MVVPQLSAAVARVRALSGRAVRLVLCLLAIAVVVPSCLVAGTVPAVPVAAGRVLVTVKRRFGQAGTYFPALRVVAQRDGDQRTPFARIENLARLRVVVH
jgi:hypothetical protein